MVLAPWSAASSWSGSQAAGDVTASTPIMVGTAVAVASVAAAVSVASYANARLRLRRCQQALARGEHGMAAEGARSLLDFPGMGSKAALVRAVALVNGGRAEKAQSFLASLPKAKRPKGAVHHYLQAAIFASQGDEEKALLHLHDCLHLDGKYALMAARHEALGPLLDRLPTPDETLAA